MQDILQYEERLLKVRAELNNLISEYAGNNHMDQKILEDKIAYFHQELDYLNRQLNLLKAGTIEEKEYCQEYNRTTDNDMVSYPSYDNQTGKTTTADDKRSDKQLYYTGNAAAASMIHSSSNKRKTPNLELFMGKSFMGVFASVLIFISFIFFATLVFPLLTDTMKMSLMYIISFGFLILGIFLIRKDSENKLYLSISGCGTGAVYISLLLSNIYFKTINDITLYLLIFVWALFVCFLSKTKSWIFQIIGQIGITLSILFGTNLCRQIDFCIPVYDWDRLLFLTVFFVITEMIFYLVNLQKEYHKNIIGNLANIVCLMIFICNLPTGSYARDNLPAYILSYGILLFFVDTIVLIGFFKLKITEGFDLVFGITNIFYFILIATLYPFPYEALFHMLVALLLLVGIEIKCKMQKDFGLTLLQRFLMLIPVISMAKLYSYDNLQFVYDYFYLSLFIVPFAIYGYYKEEKLYQRCSMIYLAIFVLNFATNDIARLLIGIVLFGLFAYLLNDAKQYNGKVKTTLYCLFFFLLVKDISCITELFLSEHSANQFAVFTILCVVHVTAKQSSFVKNWITGEQENYTELATNIINAYLMLEALHLITSLANPMLHILTILIAIVLFMMNSQNMLKHNNIAYGIYVGIKFTILVVTILSSFDAPNYILSISAFLFAILNIVCGFGFQFKSLRIYGLVLSLLSIVKLILLDITYENTAGHAFSFFVCGILCFVISTIYNVVDKKINHES